MTINLQFDEAFTSPHKLHDERHDEANSVGFNIYLSLFMREIYVKITVLEAELTRYEEYSECEIFDDNYDLGLYLAGEGWDKDKINELIEHRQIFDSDFNDGCRSTYEDYLEEIILEDADGKEFPALEYTHKTRLEILWEE